MELILGSHLKTEQTQKLILSTEMIQSLNLLQFTSNELADFISEEMTGNPVLDFGEQESSIHQMVDADRIINPAEERDFDEYNGYGSEDEPADLYGESQEAFDSYRESQEAERLYDEVPGMQEWYEQPSKFSDVYTGISDWQEYAGYAGGFDAMPYYGRNSYVDEQGRPYEFAASSELTLEESLLSQVELCGEPYMVRATAAYIIQTLDDNGYMTFSPEEIAEQLNISHHLVEEARQLIWTFDPPGVGAADLKECMKIQLSAINKLSEKMSIIIDDHLEDIAKNRFSSVARQTNMTVMEVSEAAELLRSLEPKPGRCYASFEAPRYIVPDVAVEKIHGKYMVKVNSHTAPHLVIRNDYKSMLKKHDRDSKVVSFLSDKLNSAAWLIRSIEHRRETIYKVVTEVVDIQQEFFEKGRCGLKPMTMKQIAERTGVHESTVSRAVSGKYLQCPQGVFELRYFFSGSSNFSGADGQEATSEGLKSMIEKLVETEDRTSPMSDRRIAEAILIKGIAVSRRTVAKYREELGIPSSSARRQQK